MQVNSSLVSYRWVFPLEFVLISHPTRSGLRPGGGTRLGPATYGGYETTSWVGYDENGTSNGGV